MTKRQTGGKEEQESNPQQSPHEPCKLGQAGASPQPPPRSPVQLRRVLPHQRTPPGAVSSRQCGYLCPRTVISEGILRQPYSTACTKQNGQAKAREVPSFLPICLPPPAVLTHGLRITRCLLYRRIMALFAIPHCIYSALLWICAAEKFGLQSTVMLTLRFSCFLFPVVELEHATLLSSHVNKIINNNSPLSATRNLSEVTGFQHKARAKAKEQPICVACSSLVLGLADSSSGLNQPGGLLLFPHIWTSVQNPRARNG